MDPHSDNLARTTRWRHSCAPMPSCVRALEGLRSAKPRSRMSFRCTTSTYLRPTDERHPLEVRPVVGASGLQIQPTRREIRVSGRCRRGENRTWGVSQYRQGLGKHDTDDVNECQRWGYCVNHAIVGGVRRSNEKKNMR